MSIKYIKENLKKFDHDNLISFLFDIVIRGGIDNVYDFDANKEYILDEKVYVKDSHGTHHIYKCIVDKATVGDIIQGEWIDLIQSFRKPIVTDETVVTEINIKEEVIISTIENQNTFELNVVGISDGDYTAVIFHPEYGRLTKNDFKLIGKTIVLNNEFKVKNIGEKLIVDLYRNN